MRKLAPKLNDGKHPDWYWSLSGGIDSTAAFLLTKDALETDEGGGNYSKKPVAVYLDTGIGVPLNRFYVEELCDTYGVQLWTLRTDESFLDWLRSEGAPGGGAHGNVRRKLKDRQVSVLTTKSDFPVYVLGLAADESPNRAAMNKVVEKRRHVEVYPCHRMSLKERVKVILRHENCPLNILWEYPEVIKDCGCLCHGDPSELDRTEDLFPWFAQRLREWEESITHGGLKGTLGWNGLAPAKKSAMETGQEQLTLCSDGCQRTRDPVVVQAIKARSRGASADEAIEILESG